LNLDIYLNYPGNCQEAFRFYEQHLGGKVVMMMTHGDGPNAANLSPEQRRSILHAQLQLGGTVVMGADIPKAEPMRSAYLTLTADTEQEAERLYALLSEGGQIFMKMEKTFFANRFAMLRDRFGTSWMLLPNPAATDSQCYGSQAVELVRKSLVVAIAAAVLGIIWHERPAAPNDRTEQASDRRANSDLSTVIANHAHGTHVEARGTIFRILPDDNEGSRHQRLIVKLSSGRTLLIAHNVDVAARIPDPVVGAELEFSGDYEWNEKGGLVHWTHRDPSGTHRAGWIKYRGRLFQ
jgi:PhnB protein